MRREGPESALGQGWIFPCVARLVMTTATMDASPKPTKKAADIQVLHCLNPDCRALLAYEVDSDNVLYVDLAWTAHRDGDLRFFPCPKCHGRNVVETCEATNGSMKHRVTRWQPGVAHDAA